MGSGVKTCPAGTQAAPSSRGDNEAHGGNLTRNSCSSKKQRAQRPDSPETRQEVEKIGKTPQRAIWGQNPHLASTVRASSKPIVSKQPDLWPNVRRDKNGRQPSPTALCLCGDAAGAAADPRAVRSCQHCPAAPGIYRQHCASSKSSQDPNAAILGTSSYVLVIIFSLRCF